MLIRPAWPHLRYLPGLWVDPVYSLWLTTGYTMWITEEDFLNNNMDITGPELSPNEALTTADVVYLPK